MAHIVVFAGEYDLANKDGLRHALRRLESSDSLVLDLTEVTFIDSTFIAELVFLEKVRRARRLRRMKIVSPAGSVVRRLFAVTGITAMLELVETYDDERIEVSADVVEYAAATGS